MKPETYSLGHELITEGEPLKHLYIIANGSFEVTKSLYYKNKTEKSGKEIDPESIRYIQYYSQNDIIDELFKDMKSLISSTISSKDEFKNSVKGYKKKDSRISSIGQFEVVGMIELIIDCPFSISTAKCISNEALVYSFTREDALNRISISPFVMNSIKQKLNLLSERITVAYGSLISNKNAELNASLSTEKSNSKVNKSIEINSNQPSDSKPLKTIESSISSYNYNKVGYSDVRMTINHQENNLKEFLQDSTEEK